MEEQDLKTPIVNLIENAPTGMMLVDQDLKFCVMSPGGKKGYPDVDQYKGKDLAEMLHGLWPAEFAEEVHRRYAHTLATGEPYISKPIVEQRADTDVLESWEWAIQRVPLGPDSYGVVSHFHDLSERYQYEAALQKNESTLTTILDNIPAGIIVLDTDGSLISINPAGLKLLQADSRDTLDANLEAYGKIFEVFYPDDSPIPLEDWPASKAMRGEFVRNIECKIRRAPDGEMQYISCSTLALAKPLENRILLVLQDLTDRRRSELALHESEEERRLLANPVLPVSKHIILLPLIGGMDGQRSRDLQIEVLDAIKQLRSKVMVVDVTGLVKVDGGGADGLIRTIQAAKLQGSKTILSGISQELADQLVRLELPVDQVYAITSTLEQGLQMAFEVTEDYQPNHGPESVNATSFAD